MVKTPRFHCRACRFNPWLGNLRYHMPRNVAKLRLRNNNTVHIWKKQSVLSGEFSKVEVSVACLIWTLLASCPPTSVRNPGWTGTPKPAVWVTAVNFVTESKLALLTSYNRPMNLRDQVLLQGIRPYSESGWLRRLQAILSRRLKITILSRSGCQVVLQIRDGGRWGNKVKRVFNSCKYLLEWQASGQEMC